MPKKADLDFLRFVEEKYNNFLVREESSDKLDVIPTGSISLDICIGVGGIPRGKYTTLWGSESTGKTTLALSIAKQAKDKGLKTLYIDIENGLDYKYVEALVGDIDPHHLIIIQPELAEQAFEIAEAGINSGEFGLIVFDSIGGLVPRKVKEGEFEDAHVALVARGLGQFIARNASKIRENNIAFLFINQVRAKIGGYGQGYEMPGGYSLKHNSSLIIMLSKSETIKQGSDEIGILSKFVIKKNKVSNPFKTNYIPIIFGKGVDYIRDVILFAELVGVLDKRGSYYVFHGETLAQGTANLIEYLESNPITLDKIVKECYSKSGLSTLGKEVLDE